MVGLKSKKAQIDLLSFDPLIPPKKFYLQIKSIGYTNNSVLKVKMKLKKHDQ